MNLLDELRQDAAIKANTQQMILDKKPLIFAYNTPVQIPFLTSDEEQYQGNDNNRRVAERIAAESKARNTQTVKVQAPTVGPAGDRVEVPAAAVMFSTAARAAGSAASPSPITADPVKVGDKLIATVPTAATPQTDTAAQDATVAGAPAAWKPNV